MNDKNLELLEKVLAENSIDIPEYNEDVDSDDYVAENGVEDYSNDDADLEKLVESAMRESLRLTIQESDVSDSVKVNQLVTIEDTNFSDEQKAQFIYDTLDPIVEASGIVDFEGDQPVFVPTIVFETAMALESARAGDYEFIEELNAITEAKKKSDDDEDDEDYDGEDEDEDDEDEDGAKYSKRVKESDGSDILENYINNLFSEAGIESDMTARLIIENAENALNIYGVENLLPDTVELIEMGLYPVSEAYNLSKMGQRVLGQKTREKAGKVWNWIAGEKIKRPLGFVSGGEATRTDNVLKRAIKGIKNVPGKAVEFAGKHPKKLTAAGIGSLTAGTGYASVTASKNKLAAAAAKKAADIAAAKKAADAAAAAKNATPVIGKYPPAKKGMMQAAGDKAKEWVGKVRGSSVYQSIPRAGKFAIGAAALGVIGALAYRKLKARGVAKAEAAKKTAAIIRSQIKNCASAGNPEKCKETVRSQSQKWAAKA